MLLVWGPHCRAQIAALSKFTCLSKVTSSLNSLLCSNPDWWCYRPPEEAALALWDGVLEEEQCPLRPRGAGGSEGALNLRLR